MNPGFIFILISMIIFVFEIWFIYIALNFCPKYCKICKGFLREQKHTKNQRAGGRLNSMYIKDYLEFVYAYRVDGVEYFIKNGVAGKRGDLPTIVEVVYQIRNPKRAYIKTNGLSDSIYSMLWIFTLPFLILFLVIGIIVL